MNSRLNLADTREQGMDNLASIIPGLDREVGGPRKYRDGSPNGLGAPAEASLELNGEASNSISIVEAICQGKGPVVFPLQLFVSTSRDWGPDTLHMLHPKQDPKILRRARISSSLGYSGPILDHLTIAIHE